MKDDVLVRSGSGVIFGWMVFWVTGFFLVACKPLATDGGDAREVDILPQKEADLDTHWTWVRPVKDGFSFGERAFFIKSVVGNIWGDEVPTGRNIMIRPVEGDSLALTVKLRICPVAQGDQAGLIFYYDDDHYVKVVREFMSSSGKTEILMVREENGIGKILKRIESEPESVELRMELEREKVRAFFRTDESKPFVEVGETTLPDNGKQLHFGLLAGGAPEDTPRMIQFDALRMSSR